MQLHNIKRSLGKKVFAKKSSFYHQTLEQSEKKYIELKKCNTYSYTKPSQMGQSLISTSLIHCKNCNFLSLHMLNMARWIYINICAIHRSINAIHRNTSAIYRSTSAIYRNTSAIHRNTSAIYRMQFNFLDWLHLLNLSWHMVRKKR